MKIMKINREVVNLHVRPSEINNVARVLFK